MNKNALPVLKPRALVLALLPFFAHGLATAATMEGEPVNMLKARNLELGTYYNSEINALSSNGKIAAGQAIGKPADPNDPPIISAAVWTDNADDWHSVTYLQGDQHSVYALSHDGTIAAGQNTGAVIWQGDNWQEMVRLQSFQSSQYSNLLPGEVLGLSHDGKTAVGNADNIVINSNNDNVGRQRAVVWHADSDDWHNHSAVDLGSMVAGDGAYKIEGSGEQRLSRSFARAVSADGRVIGGNAAFTQGTVDFNAEGHGIKTKAAIWERGSGGIDDWKITNLGTSNSDTGAADYDWQSQVRALSSAGTVAGGWMQVGSGDYNPNSHEVKAEGRAVIWKKEGDSWTAVALPGEHQESYPGSGLTLLETPSVNALSADGKIAGGTFGSGYSPAARPIIWHGDNWQEVLELKTLGGEEGAVNALSDDGKIAAGWSTYENDYTKRATLWRIDRGAAVDTENSRKSLALAGKDSAALLAAQSSALLRTIEGCRTVEGKFCYAVYDDYTHAGGVRENAVGLTLAYGFTPRISAGVSADYTTARRLPQGYRSRSHNPSLGVYGRWQHENGWFATGGAAFGRYTADITRPQLSGTEAGSGSAPIKGAVYQVAAGREFGNEEGTRIEPYVALRHRDISRGAYSESNGIAFPANYGELKLKETAAAAGVNAALPLGGNWSLHGGAEVEQRLGGNTPRYTAEADYIGSVAYNADINRTRARLRAGVQYAFNPEMKLSLTPHVARNLAGSTQKGATLRLEGRF
ncbi:putative membrane protein [Neisseria sp. HSC-16F19]|nr:autotransporter domain-containing protein [Neisseria sp. HSC-16F19]MCP2039769.1 putative membrane protein [Neisseria sp. HSC-16F19]